MVTDAAVIVEAPEPSSVTRNVVLGGDGLENCRWFAASAVFNCDTTDAMPSEKLTPTYIGLALAPFCSGKAPGAVTLTMVI